MTKPWTPPDLDLGDCSACKNDEYCGKSVTVNIDLKNVDKYFNDNFSIVFLFSFCLVNQVLLVGKVSMSKIHNLEEW